VYVFRRIYDEGTVNVKWFGAIGDESTDDYESIQNAIYFITQTFDPNPPSGTSPYPVSEAYGGDVVFFPEGKYRITQGLLVGQYCTLRGISKSGDHYPVDSNVEKGSVIVCDFPNEPTNIERWAVQSACYYPITVDPGPPPVVKFPNNLLEYDMAITNNSDNYTYSQGIIIEGLIFYGSHFSNWTYGAIKLSNSPNSIIRNCEAYNFHIGIMLSACHGGTTIENVYTITNWYGIVDIWNNALEISGCYINGFDCGTPFTSSNLPAFIYKDATTGNLSNEYLNDTALLGTCGIYCCNRGDPDGPDGGASGLTVISTVVQNYTNGITVLYTGAFLSGIHIENPTSETTLTVYGIVTASCTLTINDSTIAGTGLNTFGYFFGNEISATLQNVESGGNTLFVPDSFYVSQYGQVPPNRVITFANTIFTKRYYSPQIIFIDETPFSQNFGTVYVDGHSGNDDSYGFNENDAIQTFDAALIRVQNQSTLNPVKEIKIKGGTSATKDLTEKILENVNLLISKYGDGDAEVFFPIAGVYSPFPLYSTGHLLCLGNVQLCFRNINLNVQNPSPIPDPIPVAPYLSSLIVIENSNTKVSFEYVNIYLSFFSALFAGDGGVLEVRFTQSNVNGATPDAALAIPNIMVIDCLQSNSTSNPPLSGWQSPNVVRDNF